MNKKRPLKENIKKLPQGRPKTDDEQKKRHCVKVYFDNEPYRLLMIKSKRTGLPKSVLIYNLVMEVDVKERLPKEFFQYARDVSGMANNLNQLTREAHIYGILSLERRLNKLLDRMEEEIVGISHI